MLRIPFINKKLDVHTREMIGGTSVAFILKIFSAGLSFGFNVVLARMLGAEGSGVFSLALTITTTASVVSRIGLDNSLLRFIASNASDGNWKAVRGVYLKGISIAFVASALVSIIMFMISPWLAGVVFSKPELAVTLQWMCAAIMPMSMLFLYSEMLKGLKRIRDSLLVQGVGVPGISLIIFYFFSGRWGVNGAALASIVASLLMACIGYLLWYNATPHIKGIAGDFRTTPLLKSCIPLWAVAVMNTVMNWSAIFILGIWHSEADVGIFSAASRTAMLVAFILIALNSIAAPKFAALYSAGNMKALEATVRNSAIILTLFASPLLLLFIVFPGHVMGIFGSQFTAGSSVLMIMSIGQFVNVITGSVGFLLMMSGNERLLMNNIAGSAFISLFLAFLLIPRYGMMGAAIATAISIIIRNIMASYSVYRAINIITIPWPGLKTRS